jgi:hypothetical protein
LPPECGTARGAGTLAFVLVAGACASQPPAAVVSEIPDTAAELAVPTDVFAGMGFTLSESESLKVSDRLPNMISFTLGGRRGALAPGDPLFLAGASFARADVGEPPDFARRLLRATAELGDLEIISQTALVLGGLPADEIIAAAIDRKTGTPMRVYQAMVLDGKHYFLLQGMVAAANAEAVMPEFREIAHSFERTH